MRGPKAPTRPSLPPDADEGHPPLRPQESPPDGRSPGTAMPAADRSAPARTGSARETPTRQATSRNVDTLCVARPHSGLCDDINVDKSDIAEPQPGPAGGNPARQEARPTAFNVDTNVDKSGKPGRRSGIPNADTDTIKVWWLCCKESRPEVDLHIKALRRGHELAELHPSAPLSPRTLKLYERKAAFMRDSGLLPDDLATRYSKSYAYVFRAALVYDLLSRQLPAALTEGRRAIRDMDPDRLEDAAEQIRWIDAVLSRFPPDPDGERLKAARRGDDRARSFYAVAREGAVLDGLDLDELSAAVPGFSRRHMLPRLPDDWRRRMWDAVKGSALADRNKAAFAVLGAVGVRPQEIEDGILVTAKGQHAVSLTVLHPAKSHGGRYGLGQRTHTPLPETLRTVGSDGVRWLADAAVRNGGTLVVKVDRDRLLKLCHRMSRRAMPGLKAPVVTYDWRHQYSADLKDKAAEQFPDDAEAQQRYVAERMGQSSSSSQRSYGTSQQARGGVGPDIVTFADPTRSVRVKPRPAPPSRTRTAGPRI